jgi:hypothetical protein
MDFNNKNEIKYCTLGLILILFISRVFPHPPNFTAVLATILFSVSTLRSPVAFVGLLLSYLSADLIINNLIYSNQNFQWVSSGIMWILIPYVIVYFILTLFSLKSLSPLKLIIYSIGSSILFFIVSNFGVWLNSKVLYTKDFSGLMMCYYNAIPFLMNEIAGTIFYSTVIFSLYWLSFKRTVTYATK